MTTIYLIFALGVMLGILHLHHKERPTSILSNGSWVRALLVGLVWPATLLGFIVILLLIAVVAGFQMLRTPCFELREAANTVREHSRESRLVK